MSTANKLTYLNDTKGLLKQKINNLGGDITDQTTFRQYADKLQTIYDNAPKTSYAEGSNITLSNTLKGKLDFEDEDGKKKIGYGQTSQEGTPTPDSPQEIEVVRGKNLLDMSNAVGGTNNGITCTFNSDKSYSFKGTATDNNINVWFLGNYNSSTTLFTLKAGTYHIQDVILFNGTTPLNYSNFYNGPITLANDTNITGVRAPQVTSGTTYNETKYPMIVKGSQATSYLPYNTIEVVERGKNWFNGSIYNGQVGSNGGYSSSTTRITNISGEGVIGTTLLSKGTYTISIANLDYCTLLTKNSSGTILDNFANEWHSLPYTFTLTQEGYISFTARKSDNSNINPSDYNIQIETGSTATTYEPYQTPQTYQLSLGEYEFAKIGNYVDTIEYDVENDKVYKNEKIGNKTFTGASNEGWGYWNGIIFIDYTNIKNLGSNNTNFFLNYLRHISSIAYIGDSTGYRLHINLANAGLSDITSASAWKTYLSTHNLEFVYVCNEKKIEITGTLKNQIKALYYSHSFTGTTIIEIDGQLPLIIKVRALKGE